MTSLSRIFSFLKIKHAFNLKIQFKLVLIGALVVMTAAAAGSGYLYYQTRQQLALLSTQNGQQQVAKKAVAAVLQKVEKLTILPTGEDPVVATILDAHALATQSAFYQNAQNGDELIVYSRAQKAYIYSPERNLLVNVGPLILDQNQDANAAVPTNSTPVKVEIRNGSTIAGIGNKLKAQLTPEGFDVTAVGDAVAKNYPQTQVLSLNPKINQTNLQQFATQLNGITIDKLPTGETPSLADVLIIIGAKGLTTTNAGK